VSLDYIEGLWDAQDALCYITGKPLTLEYSQRTASLDRIDSSLGYVKGNIKWCSKQVNQIKYTYSLEDLRQIALDISKYHEAVQSIELQRGDSVPNGGELGS
jgi:hypothetical protein